MTSTNSYMTVKSSSNPWSYTYQVHDEVDFNPKENVPSMIDKLMKLYVTSMATPGGIGSPMPHLFGPPGCGKSTMVAELAKLVGKKLHIINVSRISPLELEGVQMPNTDHSELSMLPATFWTQLEEGDVLLLDEFLRGFPEVYNGMLDILTSRRVGAYPLPRVFIIAASNTTVTYDPALEDRLMHLLVPDPRTDKKEFKRICTRIVDTLGLLPDIKTSSELRDLVTYQILPTYEMLDKIGHKANTAGASTMEGHSIRNLIGQAQLREVQSTYLKELIEANNRDAMASKKFQYVYLLDGDAPPEDYEQRALKIKDNPKLTPLQRHNISINLQLIEMERVRKEREATDDHDPNLFA